jgi:hypothetical protein
VSTDGLRRLRVTIRVVDTPSSMVDDRGMVGFGGWRGVVLVASLAACADDAASDGSATAAESTATEGSASENGSTNDEATATETAEGNSAEGASESGASESGSADTGVVPPDVDCDDPEPILQDGTDVPTGFVRCSDGFVHRVEAVTCEVPTAIDTCEAKPGHPGSTCQTAADCTDQPYGSCAQELPVLGGGCSCVYGCASDADCGEGEICECAGLGHGPECIAAGCTTDADCDGMCGWSPIGSGCGALGYQVACLDETSECRSSCPEVEGCYGNLGEPRCEIIEFEWVCNIDSLCEDCG